MADEQEDFVTPPSSIEMEKAHENGYSRSDNDDSTYDSDDDFDAVPPSDPDLDGNEHEEDEEEEEEQIAEPEQDYEVTSLQDDDHLTRNLTTEMLDLQQDFIYLLQSVLMSDGAKLASGGMTVHDVRNGLRPHVRELDDPEEIVKKRFNYPSLEIFLMKSTEHCAFTENPEGRLFLPKRTELNANIIDDIKNQHRHSTDKHQKLDGEKERRLQENRAKYMRGCNILHEVVKKTLENPAYADNLLQIKAKDGEDTPTWVTGVLYQRVQDEYHKLHGKILNSNEVKELSGRSAISKCLETKGEAVFVTTFVYEKASDKNGVAYIGLMPTAKIFTEEEIAAALAACKQKPPQQYNNNRDAGARFNQRSVRDSKMSTGLGDQFKASTSAAPPPAVAVSEDSSESDEERYSEDDKEAYEEKKRQKKLRKEQKKKQKATAQDSAPVTSTSATEIIPTVYAPYTTRPSEPPFSSPAALPSAAVSSAVPPPPAMNTMTQVPATQTSQPTSSAQYRLPAISTDASAKQKTNPWDAGSEEHNSIIPINYGIYSSPQVAPQSQQTDYGIPPPSSYSTPQQEMYGEMQPSQQQNFAPAAGYAPSPQQPTAVYPMQQPQQVQYANTGAMQQPPVQQQQPFYAAPPMQQPQQQQQFLPPQQNYAPTQPHLPAQYGEQGGYGAANVPQYNNMAGGGQLSPAPPQPQPHYMGQPPQQQIPMQPMQNYAQPYPQQTPPMQQQQQYAQQQQPVAAQYQPPQMQQQPLLMQQSQQSAFSPAASRPQSAAGRYEQKTVDAYAAAPPRQQQQQHYAHEEPPYHGRSEQRRVEDQRGYGGGRGAGRGADFGGVSNGVVDSRRKEGSGYSNNHGILDEPPRGRSTPNNSKEDLPGYARDWQPKLETRPSAPSVAASTRRPALGSAGSASPRRSQRCDDCRPLPEELGTAIDKDTREQIKRTIVRAVEMRKGNGQPLMLSDIQGLIDVSCGEGFYPELYFQCNSWKEVVVGLHLCDYLELVLRDCDFELRRK